MAEEFAGTLQSRNGHCFLTKYLVRSI